MPIGWIVAFVTLWLVVIALAVIVLGVLRQVTPILERVAASPPAMADRIRLGPSIGERLPHFSARGAGGGPVDDRQLLGRPNLLLFVSPSCAPCSELCAELSHSQLGNLADQLTVITETGGAGVLTIPEGVRVLTESASEVSDALAAHGKPFAI